MCIRDSYNSVERWEALVQASVAHWIERYGLEEVSKWHFTIASFNYVKIPEIPMTYSEYVEMYCTTWRILKELAPSLRLGGPGAFPSISLALDGPIYNKSFKPTILSVTFQPGFGCSIPLDHFETKKYAWRGGGYSSGSRSFP